MATGWTKWMGVGLWVIGGALILATLLPSFGIDRWWIQILIFPQVHFAVLLCVTALAAAWLLDSGRRAILFLLAALLACIGYQAFRLLPYTPLARQEAETAAACPAENRLRVLVLNVLKGNARTGPVLDLVRSADPDLFLALETDPAWAQALQPLRSSYPNVVDAVRTNYWGMMLFSRLPLADAKVRYLVDGYVPSIQARVRLPSGAEPVFYGLHPKPPLSGNEVALGDAELIAAAREIRKSAAATVLAGDLNDVPWSPTTQLFQDVSGMRDPRVGRGIFPTYKTHAPLLSWPIDHIFASRGFSVIGFEKLANVGSDHFPVLATLCHRPEVDAMRNGMGVQLRRRAGGVIEAGRQ